jgi:hypothetical protein
MNDEKFSKILLLFNNTNVKPIDFSVKYWISFSFKFKVIVKSHTISDKTDKIERHALTFTDLWIFFDTVQYYSTKCSLL